MNFKAIKICVIVLICAFKLKAQTGEIYGVIINSDGDSIGAAFVSLFKEGNQIDAVYSDFNGAYFFSGIDPGSYDVSVESLGLQSKTIQGVLVGTNQKVELNFKFLASSRAVDVVEIIQYRKPLIDKEVITDEAPGIGVTGISLFIHSFTNILPGSDIAGVPASEISEIILPPIKLIIISLDFFFSLNFWSKLAKADAPTGAYNILISSFINRRQTFFGTLKTRINFFGMSFNFH